MKKLLLLFSLVLIWAGSSWGQSAIIGTGTLNTNGSSADPIERYYNYEHFQILYTAAELSAAGMTAGATINAMGFSVSESAVSLANFQIDMALTALTAPPVSSGLTTVKTPFTYTPVVQTEGNFDMITLTTPFIWDGASNLVINTCTGSNSFTSPYGGLRYTATATYLTKYLRTDGSSNCANYTLSSSTYNRPNIRLDYTPGAACSGTPDPQNTLASANPVCANTNFTLSVQNPPSGTGVTYQWQSSPNGSAPWTNLGTTPSYVASQTTATYYRCEVTCAGNTGTSTPLLVTMNVYGIPYTEGFLTTTTPTCWNITGWIIGSARGVTGNPGNNIYKNLYSSSTTGTFITGTIGPIVSGLFLTFDYITADYSSPYNPPASGSGNFVVSVSTDGGTTYTDLETVTNDGIAGWHAKSYNLDAFIGYNIKIKIVGNWVSGDYDLAFDNFKVNYPPSCPAPTLLLASNIMTTSADLDWTENGTATSWMIEYGAAGFTLGTGTQLPVSAKPFTLTGLSANTSYDYYVASNCPTKALSDWSGPKNFKTPCDAITAFSENFDAVTTPALPACWAKLGDGTANTQASSANSTPNCLYIYGYSGLRPVVVMPPVSNAGAGTHQLRFSARGNFTAGDTLEVGYMTDRTVASSFVSVAKFKINSLTYAEYIANMGTAPGANTAIAFRHSAALGYSCLIDDVNWEPIPACPYPTALNAAPAGYQATLSWTENGTATAWDIEWGAQGFTPTGTPSVGCDDISNPFILTGLTPVTAYAYYVRSDCGSGTTSSWSGPKNFTTTVACPAPTGLSTSNPTKHDIDVNWTEVGTATAWNVQYGPAGFTLGTGTIFYATAIPAQITGLNSATTYGFYVQSICGADSSTWVGPVTGTTLCEVSTVPTTTETFAGTAFPPVCWSKYTGALAAPSTLVTGGNWFQDDWRNITSPVNKAARLNIWSTGLYSWLMTPQIDLGAGSATLNLEFDLTLNAYGTSGAADPLGTDDKFAVVISTDGGFTWTSANTLRLWDNAGSTYVYNNINPAGEHITLNLAGYSGIVMFGFYGESTVSNADNDLMIDNVIVQEPPLCTAPTGVTAVATAPTTADVSWTAAAFVDIEYGPTGFTIGTGTRISGTSTNPYPITGLTSNTDYDVYVRQDCGAGLYSTWTGPVGFYTPCDVLPLPYTTDFTVADCWSQSSDLSPRWGLSATANAGGTSPEMRAIYTSGTGVSRLISPALNTAGATQLSLAFRQLFDDYGAGITYKVQSSADGINWTDEAWVNASGAGNTGPGMVNTTVVNNLGATTYIAWVLDGDHYQFDYWYIDDVTVSIPLNNDVGALSIDAGAIVDLSYTPTATVQNYGLNAATFDVTATIGAYTSTKTVTALGAGLSQQVVFDPWGPTAGDYTFQVCTALVGDENTANDCLSQSVKAMDLDIPVYGYNAFANAGTDPEGPCKFNLSNAGDLTSIADQSALQFVSSGCWAEGQWFGTVYNTAAPYDFITIDPATGARTVLGTQTVGINGLSYNPVTSTMYGVNYDGTNSNLYSIDMTTGATTLVGTCGAGLLINFAINNSGVGYAIELGADVLGAVDLTTGTFTSIGSIGFGANYAQDMEFDRGSGNLFVAAQDAASGWLGWADLTTGAVLKIADFEGGAEITGFAIPDENSLVTFNVDMSTANGFVPGTDLVYIAGNFPGAVWNEPGTNPALQLTQVGSTLTYTLSMLLPNGSYEYKYFMNAGWGGGEWAGGSNRAVSVTTATTLNDTWGGEINWANLQWPGSGTISLGDAYNVYAQAFIQNGITGAAGATYGLQAWIGFSTTDSDPSTWTNWIAAPFFGQSGDNDEFMADLGAAISATGTYYYASRFQFGGMPYIYGGFNGGFWDGVTNISGVLTVNEATKALSVKVLLEGLYDGAGGMNQAFDDLGPHWAAGIADVVTLELRNETTGAVEYTLSNVDLLTDGMISATVPSVHNGNYYIYVYHRNSIATSTALPVSFAGGTITYDFSTGISQAFGDNMKDLSGVAVIFAGDVNLDYLIDSSDMIDVDNDAAGFAVGYLATDANGDGLVDSSDMIIIDNNNALFIASILPF